MNTIVTETRDTYESAKGLRQMWLQLFEEFMPERSPGMSQFFVWLNRFDAEMIREAIQSTHYKAFMLSQEQKQMDYDYQVRYCSAVLRNLSTKQKGKQDAQ